jgi:diguanylate cyclase (GGDEF)-like protein
VTAQSSANRAPLSTLARQIVHAAVQPEVSVAELASLAERDVGFAARLLSIVNSPVHGFKSKVHDVRHASAMLGVRGMQDIALAMSVTDMIPLGPAGEAFTGISMRRATAARLLAERLKLPSPGEYFTTGLVLEMGLLSSARSDLEKASSAAKAPAATRVVRERAAGLSPHPALGGELAEEWELPETLVHAIRAHHDLAPPKEPLSHVAWAAERIAAVYEGGDVRENRAGAITAMSGLGLGRSDADALLQELPEAMRLHATSFGRSVGQQPDVEKVLKDANAMLYELVGSYKDLIKTLEGVVEEKSALVESLRQANEKLATLAATDGLTNLMNRRAFMEALVRDVSRARRARVPLSLIMIDVDHFKSVNDKYGHQVGDYVLVQVAQALARTVRVGDLLGRFGGEEFIVLLPGTEPKNAMVVAERLRAAVGAIEIKGSFGAFRVTASLGVASVPGDAANPDELVSRADQALYAAKGAGRDRVVMAST